MKLLGLVVWSVAVLAGSAARGNAADVKAICTFENPGDVKRIKASDARVTRLRAGAVQVDFAAADRPAIEITPPFADFRPLGALTLQVTNPSGEPLGFVVEVEDAAGARTSARTALPLRARESASFALPLNSPRPMTMGMRGEPAIPGFRLLAEDHHAVDLARISAIRIYLDKPGKARRMILGPVRLGSGVSYEKIVDAYGQFSKADWPGKLTSASQFQSRMTEEEAELKRHPVLPDRDEYGAWASGPKLEATGFFRAAKRDGVWWLVAPNGHLFFSTGMDVVTNRQGGTVVEGRENMFQWLPAASDPLAAFYETARTRPPAILRDARFYSGKAFNFYDANLQRKYGDDWRSKWLETALLRLRAWGMNAIGNWADDAPYGNGRVAYAVTGGGARGSVGTLSSGADYWGRMCDAFDPRFPQAVEDGVRPLAQARRDDPWLIGYFVDNELSWGGMRSERARYGLALGALAEGGDSAAKRAFVERLKARWGAVERLNEAWGGHVASWEELLAKPYRPEGEYTPAMKEDFAGFITEFARRYFRTVRDAVKKYDPHHLYLGSRFSGYTPEAVRAAAEFCDVVSFNIYKPRIDPSEWRVLDGLDKPVIIGEFGMGALDRGMFHFGLVLTADQAARAALYQDYVRSVAGHPLFVGCHYFRYNDEPLTGRPLDGENYNVGFTTVTDDVYPEMVKAAKEVNAEVYSRHARAGKR